MSQTHIPDHDTSDLARAIAARLPTGDLKLDGIATPLPPQVTAMLREILSALAAGEPVAVITHETELSPSEAAELLNVSRGTVRKLMDDGTLPFRQIGSHRRIAGAVVAAYQAKQRAVATTAMDELVSISQELGDYATPPRPPVKNALRSGGGRRD